MWNKVADVKQNGWSQYLERIKWLNSEWSADNSSVV